MVVTEAGIAKAVKFVQSENADEPIFVSVSGRRTVCSLRCDPKIEVLKKLSGIVVTPEPIVNDLTFGQARKG